MNKTWWLKQEYVIMAVALAIWSYCVFTVVASPAVKKVVNDATVAVFP
jgi:hypothetical protein